MIKTAIATVLGCSLVLQLSALPKIPLVGFVLLTALFLLHHHTRFIAITLAAALWTFHHVETRLDQILDPKLHHQIITLSGVIDSIPKKNQHRYQFDFAVNDPRIEGLIRLSWYQPKPSTLRVGQKWQLRVKLKPPISLSNPGGFDYERLLFQQEINATGYVRKSSDNQLIKEAPTFSLSQLRQDFSEHLQQQFSDSKQLGLILGLTTGLRHHIDDRQWQTLQNTGTSHLLAISGLHIGLAAVIGFYALRFIWLSRSHNAILIPADQVAAFGAIATAFFYAAMAGFAIPTQRALIMVLVLMTGKLFRQSLQASQLLAIAAILILIIDPVSVLATGFWLSFAAVITILWLTQNRFPKGRFIALKVHFALALSLIPLVLAFFDKVSLIAPLANLIAVPLVSLVTIPLLIVATLSMTVSSTLSFFCFSLVDYSLEGLFVFLNYLAQIPFAHIEFNLAVPWLVIPLSFAAILLLAPKGLPARAVILLFSLLALATPARDESPALGDFQLTLLDVGQGLSAVIRTQNHVLIFDTGAKFSDRFDMAKMVVLPYLRYHRINKIDHLVLSHSDNDHQGAATTLINNTHVEKISGNRYVKVKQTDVNPCLAGQSWQWDGIAFEFLSPTLKQRGSDNNLSCVLKVSNPSHQILLTGDIERQTEEKLVRHSREKLKATILIAPHHGSNSSSSSAFISAVSPRLVLFPAAYLNRHGFPHQAVIARYQKRKIDYLTTGNNGAIQVQLAQNQAPEISTWRTIHQRLWHLQTTD